MKYKINKGKKEKKKKKSNRWVGGGGRKVIKCRIGPAGYTGISHHYYYFKGWEKNHDLPYINLSINCLLKTV